MKKTKEEKQTTEKDKNSNIENKNTIVDIKAVVICFLLLLLWTSFYTTTYVIYKLGTKNTNLFYQKILKVTSEEKTWYQNQNVNIFGNTNGLGEKLIWEGLTGSYNFNVENVYKDIVFFGLKVGEKNLQSIEVKYRLKSKNAYIIGNKDKWVNIDEMKIESMRLLPTQKAVYTLEWQVTHIDEKYLLNEGEFAKYTVYINLYSN